MLIQPPNKNEMGDVPRKEEEESSDTNPRLKPEKKKGGTRRCVGSGLVVVLLFAIARCVACAVFSMLAMGGYEFERT